MRSVTAVVLSVGLVAIGVSAPMTHSHPDEHATDHHHGQAVHAHWGGHGPGSGPSDRSTVEAEDHDRATSVAAFVAVAVTSFLLAAVVHQPFVLPVPAERPASRRIHVTRSHDPPSFESVSPRAPPTLLS